MDPRPRLRREILHAADSAVIDSGGILSFDQQEQRYAGYEDGGGAQKYRPHSWPCVPAEYFAERELLLDEEHVHQKNWREHHRRSFCENAKDQRQEVQIESPGSRGVDVNHERAEYAR